MNGAGRCAVVQVMLPRTIGREAEDGGCRCINVRGEILLQRRLAVEGDHGNLVGDIADDGFDHRSQRA